MLDLSKNLMYRFHYEWTKPRYPGPRSELLFTDTDSLCYRKRTRDIFADMLADADAFDWSGYSETHPVFADMSVQEIAALRKKNKKVIGKMKDECDGARMKGVVCVRPKCYAIRMADEDLADVKKCKGVSYTSVRTQLTYDSYKRCVLENQRTYVESVSLRSFAHQIYTIRQVKLALINFDDKRWMCADGINTLPHGHWQTKSH